VHAQFFKSPRTTLQLHTLNQPANGQSVETVFNTFNNFLKCLLRLHDVSFFKRFQDSHIMLQQTRVIGQQVN